MSQWSDEMKARTKRFALDVIRFVRTQPPDYITDPLKRQLVKAATSVAANYRSACCARSPAQFAAKLGIVLEEADEVEGWLDILEEGHLSAAPELGRLRTESRELRLIFSSASLTARRKSPRRR
jgi:four helix bundle protein